MNFIKYIKSKDNTKLYAKFNEVPNAIGNVIIAHGLAEHLDRYDEITNYLNDSGYNVIRYDQRGHGRSEGKAFYFEKVDEIVEDLSAVLNFAKERYTDKTFLLGHSMGGYTVSLFGTKHPGLVDGIITVGALTRYNLKLFGEPDPSTPYDTYVPNELGEGVCSDKEVMEKYTLDDLVGKEISMGLVFTLLEGVKYLKENAAKLTDNILVLHGSEDGLVSYRDSLQLFDEIGSKHKSLQIYDGLEHEILNESSYNQVIFSDIVAWLDRESGLTVGE